MHCREAGPEQLLAPQGEDALGRAVARDVHHDQADLVFVERHDVVAVSGNHSLRRPQLRGDAPATWQRTDFRFEVGAHREQDRRTLLERGTRAFGFDSLRLDARTHRVDVGRERRDFGWVSDADPRVRFAGAGAAYLSRRARQGDG